MMKIDSTTVQLVLAIAEEGSISRAADRLQLAVAAALMVSVVLAAVELADYLLLNLCIQVLVERNLRVVLVELLVTVIQEQQVVHI